MPPQDPTHQYSAIRHLRRVAFLGTGYIAEWHAKQISLVKDVQLVAVCDQVASRVTAFAQKFGVPAAYTSLEDMLAAETLDAIHVLLPPDLHYQTARKILEAGINVFLEKPMCDSAADCDALVALAAQRNLRLGVGHNFLFSGAYQQLRDHLHSGVLGHIDHVTITWNRVLPHVLNGPYDVWLVRQPQNIMLEIGSHSVAHMLDLVGAPDEMHVSASNPHTLPTGKKFYRRWQVNALKGRTAIDLRFSFVPGFSEYSIHVRGSLASATVDFENNTYNLRQHHPSPTDFDNFTMMRSQTSALKQQARRTLLNYLLSKFGLSDEGSFYGFSIAKAMAAFYVATTTQLDPRISAQTGADVIRICQQIGTLANLPPEESPAPPPATNVSPAPRILLLGGTGFIGKELLHQLIRAGHTVRLLVRSTASLPPHLRGPQVECLRGDITNPHDLERALSGIECVFHLARPHVKSWADYQRLEIAATQQLAQAAQRAGVKRLIYTGTIDSYYLGSAATTITEATPLDPKISRRNLYARAKAASEAVLTQMHRDSALPVVIIRPGIVIGRGSSPLHWGVGMWWYDSICETWGRGQNNLPFVLVEDVASGLIAAMNTPGIEGRSFNLVGDPCLTAQQYLDELNRCAGIQIQRRATPIYRFYLEDMFKWVVKIAVRHPERRMPMYRDWQSRTGKAIFDCSAAKSVLGWQPTTQRDDLIHRGIELPVQEFTQ